MKGAMNVLDASGHTVLAEWDTEAPCSNRDPENGPVDPEYAQAEFARMVASGALAFATVAETGDNVQLFKNEFDPAVHTKVTFASAYAGG